MRVPLRVVFDTAIYLRALLNPGSTSARLFTQWPEHFLIYVVFTIEAELVAVLRHPALQAHFPGLSDEHIRAVLGTIQRRALHVDIRPDRIEIHCDDHRDDILLACARAAEADYLVTQNPELLEMSRHYETRIVDDVMFLAVLEVSHARRRDR